MTSAFGFTNNEELVFLPLMMDLKANYNFHIIEQLVVSNNETGKFIA